MPSLADLAHTLRAAARGGLDRAHRRVLSVVAEEAKGQAQQNARERLTMRSWALHDSIDAGVFDEGEGLSLQLSAGGPDAEHAVFQERGTTGRDGSRLLSPVHYLRDAFATVTATTPQRLLEAGGEVLTDG